MHSDKIWKRNIKSIFATKLLITKVRKNFKKNKGIKQ